MEAIHELLDPKVTAASVVGFILLYILLARYLFRPVLEILDARDREIKSAYENAQAELARAEELRADYQKRLDGVEAEARALMQKAVREAQEAKDFILSEARARSAETIERGHEQLAREKEKALAELRQEVVGISIAAASKIIEESLDERLHRKLVNDFIERIGKTE